MDIPHATWPWMIVFSGTPESRRGKGQAALSAFIEVAKQKCWGVEVLETKKFSAHNLSAGLVFDRAEVWCTFFFKEQSANTIIRMHVTIWADLVGESLFFAFERGELGPGYGTEWVQADYKSIADTSAFSVAYKEFLQSLAASLRERVPGLCSD